MQFMVELEEEIVRWKGMPWEYEGTISMGSISNVMGTEPNIDNILKDKRWVGFQTSVYTSRMSEQVYIGQVWCYFTI